MAGPHAPTALRHLTRDAWLLFATRFIRLFAYGSLSVVLVFYLVGVGLTEPQTGMLLTATLLGDTVVSLFITTRADRIGRRRMLMVGAVLMAAAGVVFASTRQLWLLVVAGTIGVISPSGHEVGPFLSIEQAALSHVVTDRSRTKVFAWYTLAGSLATALGALAGGLLARVLQETADAGEQLSRGRHAVRRAGRSSGHRVLLTCRALPRPSHRRGDAWRPRSPASPDSTDHAMSW